MLEIRNLDVAIQSVQILRDVSLELPTGTMAGSPPPCGVSSSFFTSRVSISGRSEKRGST